MSQHNFLNKLIKVFLLVSMIGSLGFLMINGITTAISHLTTFQIAKTEPYKTEFIDEISVPAKKYGMEFQMFPSIIIAQAILESDWGRSQLSRESNNLFGIKASEDDQHVVLPTQEFQDGKMQTEEAAFKIYDSLDDSILDHSYFLTGQTYQAAIAAKDYQAAAKAIQNGGYATDPDYSDKLISIIKEYKLDVYDTTHSP